MRSDSGDRANQTDGQLIINEDTDDSNTKVSKYRLKKQERGLPIERQNTNIGVSVVQEMACSREKRPNSMVQADAKSKRVDG